MKTVTLIALINLIPLCAGANILAYILVPSYSHQLVYRPLWKELSLRGHHVTVFTTDPMNDTTLTNLTEVDLHSSYKVWNKHVLTMVNAGGNWVKVFNLFNELISDLIDVQMTHPEVQNLMNNPNKKFDVILVESLFAPPAALSRKLNCPLIGISTAPVLETLYSMIGVPTHPILYPDPLLSFDKPDTFLERVSSVTYYLIMNFFVWPFVLNLQNQLIEKYLGTEFGAIDNIINDASMMFVNQNPTFDYPRPVPPNIVYVGGIHKTAISPLPKELKSNLDSATEGFIYFSLGTNVKSKDISPTTRQVILDTFSELPYMVLWKFELDTLENKPNNVLISKWYPQVDVLNHPNIKLFITHGGLASLDECIFARVPMVAMPFFGDQIRNVRKMVRKGIALSLDHETLEKEHFKATILEVIGNRNYRKAVEEISDLVQDQPMTGLERAVWWTEYVIRHKGAAHLRSPLIDISWSQYLFLDVIACLFAATAIVLLLFIILIRVTVKCVKNIFTVKNKQKKL